MPEALSEVVRHLESAYPREGCGVLLRVEGEGPWRFRPLRNAHAAPRIAYSFDPREWLAVLLEAESRGEQVACVVHSHVDCSADFSDEDRRQAAPEGHPLLPGVSYLVMAVHAEGVRDTRIFRWECGEFREFPFSPGS